MSLLADRFPARRLGFAAAVYYMGVPIGVGASLLVAGYLGPVLGWRGSFYALGALGLAFAVVLLFVRETPRHHATAAHGAAAPRFRDILPTVWQALRVSPALCYTLAGGVALHFILGAAAFDQLWYVRERGFDRAFIAQATGWIGMIGGVLGNLVGGIAGDWWLRRTGQGRPMLLVFLGLLIAPFTIAYRLVAPDSVFFWLGIFLGFFKLGSFYGPTFSTVQELVPPRIRATVVAFYILLLNLIGLGFGITAGGFLVDRLIAAGVAEPYTKTLLGFTIFSLLAIPLFYLAGRHFERDRERLRQLEARAA
jgi:MFS family permease